MSDTYTRDDCGAFVYSNGFRFPIEDTGSIVDACRDFHAGQGCPLYQLQSSMHATPSLVVDAAHILEQCIHQWDADFGDYVDEQYLCDDAATYHQGLEDLARWAEGIRELADTQEHTHE